MNIRAIAAYSPCTPTSTNSIAHRPDESSPDDVLRQLIFKRLVRPGNGVRFVTSDNAVFEYRVTEADFEKRKLIGEIDRPQGVAIAALQTEARANSPPISRCRIPGNYNDYVCIR